MPYAENWTQVDITQFDLDRVLLWCAQNLEGQQFIEHNVIKFEDKYEADKFIAEYQE